MSDDEDYYDDDDDEYFYTDDGPVAEADDLAEHTMHSPVLKDHDPSDDLAEYWSDWEYYSDDYYDEAPARSKQDVISNGVESRQTGEKRESTANNGGRRKRRKQDLAEARHGRGLGDRACSEDGGTRSNTPIVVWRSKEEVKNEPVTHQGNGERVALLKDWRVIFGTHSHDRGIRRNPNLKKRGPGQPIETQASMDGYRVVATRVPRVARAHASPPSRRDMPDRSSISSPEIADCRPPDHLTLGILFKGRPQSFDEHGGYSSCHGRCAAGRIQALHTGQTVSLQGKGHRRSTQHRI